MGLLGAVTALLAVCYLMMCLWGPWPELEETSDLDAMTPEEFLMASSLDINSATREELMELPGIGEALADAIVGYREIHGPFASLEELEEVEGIGPERRKNLEIYLRVG